MGMAMTNRVKQFLGNDTIYKPPMKKRKKKPIKRMCTSKGWVTDPPIISAVNFGTIPPELGWLLARIDNFCYYDEEGNLHVFFGSDKYLSSLEGCSIRVIQRRLAILKEKELLISWTETIKKGREIPITYRYMCTPWVKEQGNWLKKWIKKYKPQE